jgi:hypothetical protein
MLALLAQQLDVHGELPDLGLEPGDQLIPAIGGPALQRGFGNLNGLEKISVEMVSWGFGMIRLASMSP